MNYLAHFHLSHGNDDLLIGALLGDFVKGPLKGERSKKLEQGIYLHRKIDAFTDSHPPLVNLQRCFAPEFRRYGAIMTDVVFDHFLNQHWDSFHTQSLPAFSAEIYQLLSNSQHLMPKAKAQADNLSRYKVFENFQHWQTVEGALARVGQRLKRDNPLAIAAPELEKHYAELEAMFLQFYPQLQEHVRTIRAEFDG